MATALLLLVPQGAQAQETTGTLRGTVQAASVGAPLAYAVVRVPALNLERFTDGNGRFTLTALTPGSYTVEVRRIGFVPYRGEATITAGAITVLTVSLDAIPVRIESLTVRAIARCTSPGLPDATREPAVAALVSLLRENADRYRLLASQYPFVYQQVRALVALEDEDDPAAEVRVQLVDTLTNRSATRVEYRAGDVVQRERFRGGINEYSMTLPTILDLADDRFARAHCFSYGGRDVVDDETWLRLEVRASDRLKSPDVHGTFYLDSATAQLRRMDLELSRADRLPRELAHIEAVTVRTRFVEIAPGLSIIDAVCAVNRPKARPRGVAAPLPAELQILSAYEFTAAPTGVLPFKRVLTPRWRRGGAVRRSAVWCVE